MILSLFYLKEAFVLGVNLMSSYQDKEYIRAKEYAFNFLSYRVRSEKEIRDQLIYKGFNEVVTNRVIELLKRHEYIDDESFASAFVQDSVHLKYRGKNKIIYDLKHKGINSEIINNVINSIQLNEINNVKILINKKIGDKKNNELSHKERNKLYQFLIRKGFSYDIIRKAFEDREDLVD